MGDKRDDTFADALRIGERPVCHPASVPSGLGVVTGDVVFSKLSKLLNQEDALSAPCLKHSRNYSGPIKLARCGPGQPGPRKGLSLRSAPIAKLLTR